MENHFFLMSRKGSIYSTVFDPNCTNALKKGVLICHPFAEEKKSSQAILVNLAREICKVNVPVFMFDYFGCGDSEGMFKDSSLSLWINNTLDAVSFFKKVTGLVKITLIGLRLGGYIANVIAESSDHIDEVILIEPVLNPTRYFNHIFRQKQIRELKMFGEIKSSRDDILKSINQKGFIDLDGYEITKEFYNNLSKYNTIDFRNVKNTYTIIQTKSKKSIVNDYIELPKKVTVKSIRMMPFWNRIEKCDYTNLLYEITKIFKEREREDMFH